MEELRAFVDKSLNFSDDLTLGLRNQARCEVYAKFQLSGLKGTQEWEELWVEAEPRLKLETVQQSTLGKVYMCVRMGLMSWYWASLALPILFSMPLWSLNFHLKRRSRLWRWLGPMDFLQRILLSSMLTVVGVEVEASGEENTVDEVSMILYNHGSNCDSPVIVTCHVKSLCFWIGKKEILCLPILGVLFWFQGHLFINRRKREESIRAMNHFISGVMKKNKPVCIAPEGARSKNGHLQEFKKGPFHAQFCGWCCCAKPPLHIIFSRDNRAPVQSYPACSRKLCDVPSYPPSLPAPSKTGRPGSSFSVCRACRSSSPQR
eukprot:GEMP01019615.1.p1 GENE.GEMP01019615.1~~GEMP01019615.1.p1  ORF type:complete len:319 (+),score=30.40 GEMP01019615.1:142-1098(+)